MKAAIRAFLLWFILGGLTWIFVMAAHEDMSHFSAICGSFLLAGLGFWLTVAATRALPEQWPWRFGFWMITVPVWVALFLVLEKRVELHPTERLAIAIGLGLGVIGTAWLSIRLRPLPVWRVSREIALVVTIDVVALGAFLAWYELGTRAMVRKAEARWTDIGLPMAEFEKTLETTHENSGSKVFRGVLLKQIGAHFYKEGTRAAEREPAIVQSPATENFLKKAVAIGATILPPSDDIDLSGQHLVFRSRAHSVIIKATSKDTDLSAQFTALIEPVAASLDDDYRRMLTAEPPTWSSDPRDGYFVDVPNFLAIRKFAQLCAADGLRRLAAGDEEGAARALSAPLCLKTGLRQNGTLVALMIDVAVEALIAQKQVRLPPSKDGLRAIAQDVGDLRSEFLRRLQIEGWVCLRYARAVTGGPLDVWSSNEFLPDWAARIESGAWMRRELAIAAFSGAEHAAIQEDPATVKLPDFGQSRYNAVSTAWPTSMEANTSRAAMRIYATLLLREQSELIRIARARMAAGQPVESYDSAVIPGARWELSANPDEGTVSTRLAGAPAWVLKGEVTPPDFWCLPIDGSGAWKFHRPAHTAQEY
jgi:hypothetical protein